MKLKLAISLTIVIILAIAALRGCGDDDRTYNPAGRPVQIYAPLEQGRECPPHYFRYNDYQCWDEFVPTPMPFPSETIEYIPTATALYIEAAARATETARQQEAPAP